MTSVGSASAPDRPGRPSAGPRERWLNFRNRLIASPAFQRWAASFPLTRGVSRRRTERLFDICGGFVYSQVLFACVSLDIFKQLSEAPADIDELSRRHGFDPDAMTRLIRAAVSLDLLEPLGGGRYTLGQLGAAMAGNDAIAEMTAHHAMLYADLADPLALLRGQRSETELGAYWGYGVSDTPAEMAENRTQDYTALMAASQSFVCEDALDAYDFSQHTCLMDVGGGNGTFLSNLAARHRDLDLRLFDLPAVTTDAKRKIAADGLEDRIEIFGGDFFKGPLPTGADAVSLVRILHDHDDARASVLLSNIHGALNDSGTLILVEPMADSRGRDPITDAYFGFYFLALGSGKARTFEETSALLAKAGFRDIREHRTRRPVLTRLLTAKTG